MIQFPSVTQHELSQLLGLIKDKQSSIGQSLKANGVTVASITERAPDAGTIILQKKLSFVHINVPVTYALSDGTCTVTALEYADKAEPQLQPALTAALMQIRSNA